MTWLYICEKDPLLTTPCAYNNALYIYNAIDDNSVDMALGHVTYWIKNICQLITNYMSLDAWIILAMNLMLQFKGPTKFTLYITSIMA